MSFIHRVPPPPSTADPGLFRWFTDVRAALGLEALRTPALLNGWVDYGAPYGGAAYWLRLGVVHLTGLVRDGGLGTNVFALPTGFRPAARLVFATLCDAGVARVDVLPDGAVLVASAPASNGFLSLEGIAFRVGG